MKIAVQTLTSSVFGLAFFAIALCWPAGTVDYPQAWVFIVVFKVCTIIPSLYHAVRNPDALQRRLNAGPLAETRLIQKVVISATVVSVLAVLIVSALDHRFGWSDVPVAVVAVADVLVAVGLILAQAVVFQNSFAGASIRVEAEQQVVSTGLYGLVRHPMYSGALLMMLATPLALGSYWGVLAAVLSIPVLCIRIIDEEKMLRAELDGYDAYTEKVAYRLLPYVW
jgi:protein-S-isoprenylcysteine O-methyltransferase Ste14